MLADDAKAAIQRLLTCCRSAVTGSPALAKHIAMPPPIVPAPITPPLRWRAHCASGGSPGTLRVSRSAKNTWISAFDFDASPSTRLASSLSYTQPLLEWQACGGAHRLDRGQCGLAIRILAFAPVPSDVSMIAGVAVAGSTLRSDVRRGPARSLSSAWQRQSWRRAHRPRSPHR